MENYGGRSKLFDDDDDDGNTDQYVPVQLDNQQNNQTNTQPKNEPAKEKEEEFQYQPTYEQQDHYQPQYQQEQKAQTQYEQPPSQYANERNNLMQEQPVEIDYNAHQPSMKETSKKEQQKEETKQQQQIPVSQNQGPSDRQIDMRIKEEAERAKKKMLDEINKLTVPDENIEEETKEVLDPRQLKFTVTNPVKVSGHIRYTITGEDQDGQFEESRRFKEFFALRNVLVQRWPGIYIPAIPEKQLVGNKDIQFIEERRVLLERFMKELSKFEYLINSKEFRIFARDKGDIEKILNSLLRQTPMQILEKYRLNFKIDEDKDANSMQKYKENIMDFQTFLRKVVAVMEVQKKQLKEMINIRDTQDRNYGLILQNLMKYEDQNVEYYSDSDLTKRILTHPSAGDMKEKVDNTSKGWKNSYKDLYIWLKGELLDIKGIIDGIQGRESVVKMQSNCQSKKRSDESELDKLTQGKKTIKSIFKSKSSKENDILNLQAAIEVANKDIQDYSKLINFLTIYHGEIALAKFKKEKLKQYFKALHIFCVREISNSHLSATLWHSLLEISTSQ